MDGTIVWTATISQGFFGGLPSILGGSNQAFTAMCQESRKAAYDEMVQKAISLGANAVVGARYSTGSISEFSDGSHSSEVVCYGTSVISEPKKV